MARVYRRGDTWWLDYFDAAGARQRVSSRTTDRREAEHALAKIVVRERRRRAGLWDPGEEFVGRPILEHLEAFRTHLEAKDVEKKHRDEVLRLVRLYVSECDVRVIQDLQLGRAEAWLVRLKRQGLSARTVNKCRAALIQWGRWLVRSHRMPAHPFDGLPIQDQDAGRVRERRALTLEEIGALFRAVPYLRRIVYELAMVTGLRRGELEDLRADQLHGEVLTVRAGQAKNRKGRAFVLPPELAADLARIQDPTERVRALTDARTHGAMRQSHFLLPTVPSKATVYRDMRKAGIRRVVEQDGAPTVVVDFHSLRVTFGTLLERAKTTLQTAQRLMRHSDPKLTSNVYTDVGDRETASALASVWTLLGSATGRGTPPGTSAQAPARKRRRAKA